jgi:hypothetical protein
MIRLAHENPELRSDLLSILREAGDRGGGSDGNYMTKQNLWLAHRMSGMLHDGIPDGVLLPDWAESKINSAAQHLKEVAGWAMHESRDNVKPPSPESTPIRLDGEGKDSPARTAAPTVTLDGVKCKWVRDPKRSGRSEWGRAPDKFRGWSLKAPDGSLKAMISHTHDVPSYATPTEAPGWRITIRFPVKESDRAKYGGWRDFTLKARVPAPDGDTDEAAMKRALDLAVTAYEKQSAIYNAP